MEKLKLLKNDVIIFNYLFSKPDRNGNRYQNFGDCYIIRRVKGKYKKIHFDCKDRDGQKYVTNYMTTASQEVKEQMKLLFKKDITYLSQHANIVIIETEVNYRDL